MLLRIVGVSVNVVSMLVSGISVLLMLMLCMKGIGSMISVSRLIVMVTLLKITV